MQSLVPFWDHREFKAMVHRKRMIISHPILFPGLALRRHRHGGALIVSGSQTENAHLLSEGNPLNKGFLSEHPRKYAHTCDPQSKAV